MCALLFDSTNLFKKIKYYSGNYDVYVETDTQDMVQMRAYEAGARDIADIKVSLPGSVTVPSKWSDRHNRVKSCFRKARGRFDARMPAQDDAWDWSFRMLESLRASLSIENVSFNYQVEWSCTAMLTLMWIADGGACRSKCGYVLYLSLLSVFFVS
jgi:ATPase subunit of ABC transporter with duplicated ATPase domains